MSRSFDAASGLSLKLQILPPFSTATKRFAPGTAIISSASFSAICVKACSGTYGFGGSGEPWMREVVHWADADERAMKQARARNMPAS
jgi:hypothetical protein